MVDLPALGYVTPEHAKWFAEILVSDPPLSRGEVDAAVIEKDLVSVSGFSPGMGVGNESLPRELRIAHSIHGGAKSGGAGGLSGPWPIDSAVMRRDSFVIRIVVRHLGPWPLFGKRLDLQRLGIDQQRMLSHFN